MAKTGDIVRFLNSVGGGKITKIKDGLAYVEDEDGFETPVLLRECVVVGSASVSNKPETAVPAVTPNTSTLPHNNPAPVLAPTYNSEQEELPVIETAEGEKINLTLAFEPQDIKKLSETSFDTYLVNDSNYFLYFTYLTQTADSNLWETRYAGLVEPNIQIFLGTVTHEDLSQIKKFAVQYIAFKRDKAFTQKTPSYIEERVDNLQFQKLHSFLPNVYFDKLVIAFELVTNDTPKKRPEKSEKSIAKAIKEKKAVDRPQRKLIRKRTKAERRADNSLVVDLHIHSIVDNVRGLSNADMLNLQIDEFSRIMDENLKNQGQKIIFIHGKGEGVLRNAIMKELNHRYKGHDVQDASFKEYGYGATQVTIRVK